MPKTNFSPQTDGFAFVNLWTFDQAETDAVAQLLNTAVDGALTILNPLFGGALVLSGLSRRLVTWAEGAVPQTYGLCGGMAFAALDYYAAGIRIPEGNQPPTRVNPAGTTLRDYLDKRQLDSLRDNLSAVLAWMAVLKLIPQWWTFRSGSPWLLDQTKEQWQTLTKNIDAGQPTPLALIGTTANPMENHQVVAYGYEDAGDGTGTIYVYDMDCPEAEQRIVLDFRGRFLSAPETCANPARGPLCGFICEKYTSAAPPTVTDWTSSVSP